MFYNYKGQQIYYQTVGKGKSLVLLHGWNQDVSTWWPIVDFLKDEFKLYLIDMPGFGRSDLPKKPWNIMDYANCIASFIKEQKIKKPILLGHSLGGNIAIKIGSKYPNLISKLILEDASGIRKKSTLKNYLFLIIAKIIKYITPNILNLKKKLQIKFYQAIDSDYLSAGQLKLTLQNILAEDVSSDAKKIAVETLIIWGEKDMIVPMSKGKMLYQLIFNSRFVSIDNTNHFPHLENSGLFTYYVKDFS